MRRVILVLVLLLGACGTDYSKDNPQITMDYSLRKRANTTTFLSSVLYYKPNSTILSDSDKKALDQTVEFYNKYPSVVKIISYASASNVSKERNKRIEYYLKDKIKPIQLSFEQGTKNELIYSDETLKKDEDFSTRTEIYISY